MSDNADLMTRLQRLFENPADSLKNFEQLRDLSDHDLEQHDKRCTQTNCPERAYRVLMLFVMNELVRAHGGKSWSECDDILNKSTH